MWRTRLKNPQPGYSNYINLGDLTGIRISHLLSQNNDSLEAVMLALRRLLSMPHVSLGFGIGDRLGVATVSTSPRQTCRQNEEIPEVLPTPARADLFPLAVSGPVLALSNDSGSQPMPSTNLLPLKRKASALRSDDVGVSGLSPINYPAWA